MKRIKEIKDSKLTGIERENQQEKKKKAFILRIATMGLAALVALPLGTKCYYDYAKQLREETIADLDAQIEELEGKIEELEKQIDKG